MKKILKGTKYFYKNMGFLNIVDSVFRFYQSFLSRNHLIDFNDMINKAIKNVEMSMDLIEIINIFLLMNIRICHIRIFNC